MLLQEGKRFRSQIRPCSNAEPLNFCCGHRPYSGKLGNWQRCNEIRLHGRGDYQLAIRLALPGRQLGKELVVRDTRRRRETYLVEYADADFLGSGQGSLQTAQLLCDVEIGFIEREWFDQMAVVSEDGVALT